MIRRFIRPEQHGTTTGYSYGCRDDCCRKAHRESAAARKSRLPKQPRKLPPPRDSQGAFWGRVSGESAEGCWTWLGSTTGDGYGRFRFEGKRWLTHRLSWTWLIGELPGGLTLDHLCRNRACVNPWHLEPVPHAINVLRGESPTAINARKTHCPKGHPYEGANVIWQGSKNSRQCRTCQVEYRQRPDVKAKKAQAERIRRLARRAA